MSLSLVPVSPPESLDAPDAGDFIHYFDLVNEVMRHDSGSSIFDTALTTAHAAYTSAAYRVRLPFLLSDGGSIIGGVGGFYERAAPRVGQLDVFVRPDSRTDEVLDAAIRLGEDLLAGHGCEVVQTFSLSGTELTGAALSPASGFGAIPAETPMNHAFVRAGYTLGQVERASAVDLNGDLASARALLGAAWQKAGSDYRLEWWHGATPDHLVDGYAAAVTRMATDPPAGELQFDPEVWDAARVRHREDLQRTGGMVMAVTAVVHVATGEVAAFNELVIAADRTRPTENYGTLVMPEHRGRRLGSIVKCEGLIRWQQLMPDSPCVMTFNAEENRFMLDVNEAVGFVPVAYSGEWTKSL